jgi:prepilin-type N-terminal cleavage/methylation domain-containing protein
MKNLCKRRTGFTLLELLVAMTVTAFIVTSLVAITSIAIDTWNRSRSELRAARQAKSMVDSMARDFESLVIRRGNDYEWLSAKEESPDKSSNAATLVFFTAATDRYDGQIGTNSDLGGDVSCVGYQLKWRDPISAGTKFQTFVLNRLLVDPKDTFDKLLGKTEIGQLFLDTYRSELAAEQNFVCENIFQFTVTFHVQVTDSTKNPPVFTLPVSLGDSTKTFRILGSGITTDYKGPSAALVPSGRITAVEISLTVLSDSGIEQLRKANDLANDAAWLAKNSYQYSKLVQLPGM